MPKDQLQKQKKIQEFRAQLGNEEVNQYEQNMFKDEYQGGLTEAEALIERYSAQTKLTDEEKNILRTNVPEAPGFPLLKEEQYNSKSCWGKKKYRGKVKDYYLGRKKYYTSADKIKQKDGKVLEQESKGQIYARTRQEIEERIAKETGAGLKTEQKEQSKEKKGKQKQEQVIAEPKLSAEELVEEAKKEGLYEEIEESAKAMDEAYQQMKEDQKFIDSETKIGQVEAYRVRNEVKGFGLALSTYSGPFYGRINGAYRSGERPILGAEKLADGIKQNPLNRDLVCRRGVKGVKTLAHMMGLENADQMNMEQIKEAFEDQFYGGNEVILSDKSFMSTSLPFATSNFGAGDGLESIGIEFMILMKKGTQAMNISSLSSKRNEQEVLVAPGAKFKVIKAELDGDADILYGSKKSWKIWLVSVPSGDDNQN